MTIKQGAEHVLLDCGTNFSDLLITSLHDTTTVHQPSDTASGFSQRLTTCANILADAGFRVVMFRDGRGGHIEIS